MYCRNCGKELTGSPELCMNCGAKPQSGNSFCHACGNETNALAEICINCGVKLSKTGSASPKSRAALSVLSFFLGELGMHRFYVGKIGTGIIMLVLTIIGYATMMLLFGFAFLGIVWLWNLIDFIMAVSGNFKDREGKTVSTW
jgi:TM2 domain-containing membrane protein YozV